METKTKQNIGIGSALLIALMTLIVGSFGIIEEDFTEEVNTINIDKFCLEKSLERECIDKSNAMEKDKSKFDTKLNQSIISIKKDPLTKVIRVEN